MCETGTTRRRDCVTRCPETHGLSPRRREGHGCGGDEQEAHRFQPLIKSRVRAAVLGLLQAEGDALGKAAGTRVPVRASCGPRPAWASVSSDGVPCRWWVAHVPFTPPTDSLLIVAELLCLSVVHRGEHFVTRQLLQTNSLGMGLGRSLGRRAGQASCSGVRFPPASHGDPRWWLRGPSARVGYRRRPRKHHTPVRGDGGASSRSSGAGLCGRGVSRTVPSRASTWASLTPPSDWGSGRAPASGGHLRWPVLPPCDRHRPRLPRP